MEIGFHQPAGCSVGRMTKITAAIIVPSCLVLYVLYVYASIAT